MISDFAPALETSLDEEVVTYLQQTYAPSTQRTYKTHKESYLAFCSVMGYEPVPATTMVLCRYASFLARSLKFSSIKQYLNIIRLLHLEWQLPNPMHNNYQLNCVLRGIRPSIGDSPSRKLPVNPAMLAQILSKLDLSSAGDSNIWAAGLLMFFAMLRRSNVLCSEKSFDPSKHLRRRDLVFHEWGILVHIRWTKTIQFKERTLDIPLPRMPKHPLCPVAAIFHAWSFSRGSPMDGPAFLVPVKDALKPLSSNTFINRIKEILKSCGVNSSLYSGHSFRRGGATWAYQVGVPVDTIRIIGDWKSNAYTSYINCSVPLIRRALSSMVKKINV